jgi:hypothetical protein
MKTDFRKVTVAETQKRLEKVDNLFDFQEEFYWENPETGEMIPDYELVYFNGENYTSNPAARTFDKNGNCTNIFIKCSDGVVEYPF